MMKKGALFDLDGTLTLTQQFHQRAFAKMFQKFGIQFTPEDDFYYAGSGSSKTFPGVFAKHGVKNFDLEQCAEEKREFYEELLAKEEIKAVPGVKKFLNALLRDNIPFMVASGNRKEFVEQILHAAGLKKYFPEILTNHDVAHGKPAPDIFLEGAKRLKVAPKDCVVFEDAFSGIKAAKAAGMYCIGLATGAPAELLRKAGADFVIQNFTQLPYATLFAR